MGGGEVFTRARYLASVAGWLGEGERGGKHAHEWSDDVCLDCDLRRAEAWTLDAQGRSVMTLVWSSRTGHVVRVRPFAYLLGVVPRVPPTQTAEQAYPGIKIGKEPKCPHERVDWDADGASTEGSSPEPTPAGRPEVAEEP